MKDLVNTPQFKPFVEENRELSEEVLEKFEDEEDVTLDFINKEIRGNDDLKESFKSIYTKYQEKIKKRVTLDAPKKQIEKAIDVLQNIDFNIVLRLDDESDYPQFLNSLEELEQEVNRIKKEVYGNDTSSYQ